MTNEQAAEVMDRVVEVPEWMLEVTNCSEKAIRNSKLASALKVLKVGQGISYTQEEFTKFFGKHGRASLVIALKNRGIKKPATSVINGKVIVFNRKEV